MFNGETRYFSKGGGSELAFTLSSEILHIGKTIMIVSLCEDVQINNPTNQASDEREAKIAFIKKEKTSLERKFLLANNT